MARGNYSIKMTTYTKIPTGELNEYGKLKYMTKEKKESILENTNFSNMKKSTYEKSKKDKNVYVKYSKPTYSIYEHPKRLVNVTKKFADGHKEVTYFNPVRNSNGIVTGKAIEETKTRSNSKKNKGEQLSF